MSTILQALVNGSTALARIRANGLKAGDSVYIDTKTAPTKDSKHIMYALVTKVHKDGAFDTDVAEPYFGYNKNWNINQIVG